MTHLPFKQVDVFNAKPFLGNPVAVVIGGGARTSVDGNLRAA